MTCRIQPWFPGQASVGRGAHEEEVLLAGIVPFHVTVSEKGAGWSVVASDPVFVGIRSRTYPHRAAPVEPVGRTAHRYFIYGSNGERRNQPSVMCSVEGHGRIARCRESSSLKRSDAW